MRKVLVSVTRGFFYTKGRDFRLGQFNQRKSKGIFKKNERKKNLYKAY